MDATFEFECLGTHKVYHFSNILTDGIVGTLKYFSNYLAAGSNENVKCLFAHNRISYMLNVSCP